LVLDTKGINVWCAAGKGTFGTEELIKRIASSGLKEIVSHRQLILPQRERREWPPIREKDFRLQSMLRADQSKRFNGISRSGMKVTPTCG